MEDSRNAPFNIPTPLDAIIVQPPSAKNPPGFRLQEQRRLLASIIHMDKYK